MNERILHTPEGVRDIYNVEYRQKKKIMDKLHQVFSLYNYRDIQTPTFEYFEVFGKEKGSAASSEMFKFFDRDNNTLVLRPDITPGIARCVAKYYEHEELPIRLCYEGNTFTNKPSHQGKLCEHTELGGELFNDDSSAADAEILATVVDCFRNVGIKDFQIEIGEVDYLKGIFEEYQIKEEDASEIRDYLTNRNFFGLQDFLRHSSYGEEVKQTFAAFDKLFGGVEVLAMAKSLVTNPKSIEAAERLEKVYHALEVYGAQDHIGFDLSMVSDYKYYTGILIKGYTYGTGEAVVRGGRYNALLQMYGKDAPAIGFVFAIDLLMEAMHHQKIQIDVETEETMILYRRDQQQKAIEMGIAFRRDGKRCELIRMSGKKTLEDYKEYAKREGFARMIYVTEREDEEYSLTD